MTDTNNLNNDADGGLPSHDLFAGFYGLDWKRGANTPYYESQTKPYLVVLKDGNRRKIVVAYYFYNTISSGKWKEWWIWDLDELFTGFLAIPQEVMFWAELPASPKMRMISNQANVKEHAPPLAGGEL